jgi:tyrosyl-tRNA synthetase
MNKDKEKIEQALTKGVERIYPSKQALKRALLSGKKLRVYQGFDPSMPNLHLGNMVGVMKLKQFQELGHQVIFLVGDLTAMIGDPTDKSAARKMLTRKQVLANCKAWKNQASRFLSFSGNNPAIFMFNSKWLDKITFKDLIEITSHFTVQQMIQRDFFQRRLKREKPIYLHEFLYPIAQAIDCVEMDVDLEVGGSDQTFNMLAGRTLMKAVKNKEKFVLTTKLLVDKHGNKVGKTKGNAIFLNTKPKDMFGKIMSYPDEIVAPAFELLTDLDLKQIKTLIKQLDPLSLKKRLAFEVVKVNYGEQKASQSQQEFERVFKRKEVPQEIETAKLKKGEWSITELLTTSKLACSKSEAKRLVDQKGVKINKRIVEDWRKKIVIKKGDIIQVGRKRFVKII